jgi:L-ascorbate metabolism protein UlaG (beta-lactamase superfamily)
MKIKKIGHCCLLINDNGKTILTDPGAYSTAQNDITNIDIVLITHEHPDHLHTESLQQVLKNNPNAIVVSNTSVSALLQSHNIAVEIIEEGDEKNISDFKLQGFGTKHADIFDTVTPVQNTGYFINDRLFYPGDALIDPKRTIDILALPVAGPWLTIRQALEYAIALKPKFVFPVHDGMLVDGREGPVHRLSEAVLPTHGINFITMKEGDEKKF